MVYRLNCRYVPLTWIVLLVVGWQWLLWASPEPEPPPAAVEPLSVFETPAVPMADNAAHNAVHYANALRNPEKEAPKESTALLMVASWYGQEFGGLETASGEIFNPEELTAAHRTLPLGTIMAVENPETLKTVKVTVNDRGPFVSGRDLDLSARAFREIADPNKGVIKVRATIIAPN